MISDNPVRKTMKSSKNRPVRAQTNLRWSDNQKLEAVQTYLVLGNARLTAGALKIPLETIYDWKSRSWWKELEEELRLTDELQLSAKLQKITAKSLDAVEDRLEHGNWVYDQKTGGLRRIPAPLKDVHKVALDSVSQRDIILKRKDTTINDGQVEDKLEKLAERFAEIAANKIKNLADQERTVEMVEEVTEDLVDAIPTQQ